MPYWVCDPDKNIFCKKKTCFINGGKCHITSDPTYARRPDPLTTDEGWGLGAKSKHNRSYRRKKKKVTEEG